MASRALRSVMAVCFAAGWGGVFWAPACSKTYSCTGEFMYKDCSRLDADTCTHVHGCRKRTPACVNGCDVGIGCGTQDCLASPCTSLCTGAQKDDCEGLTASLGVAAPSLHLCAWTTDEADGGASCRSVCSPLKSEKACSEQSSAGCAWVVCEGTVKDDCSSYSGDECPTSLGCDRTTDAVE